MPKTSTRTSEEILKGKQESFMKLAPGRITVVKKGLDKIAALAAKGSYASTPEQQAEMFTYLEGELASAKAAYAGTGPAASGFQFGATEKK